MSSLKFFSYKKIFSEKHKIPTLPGNLDLDEFEENPSEKGRDE